MTDHEHDMKGMPECVHIWNAHRKCQWCGVNQIDAVNRTVVKHVKDDIRRGGSVMTARELAALVAKMRDAQRRYFKNRQPSVLTESKQLERQVDQACEEILHGLPLFPEPNNPQGD